MKKLFALFCVLQFLTLTAQTDPSFAPVKWVNEKDGLTQLFVNKSIADKNGFVWIATQLGLYKYDWEKATIVSNKKYPQLNNQRITNLFLDDNTGIIYFDTFPDRKKYSIIDNEIQQLKGTEGFYISNDVFVAANNPFLKSIAIFFKNHKEFVENNFLNDVVFSDIYCYLLYSHLIVIIDKKGGTKSIPFDGSDKSFFFKFGAAIFVNDINNFMEIKGNEIKKNTVHTDIIINDFIKNRDQNQFHRKITRFDNLYYINHKNKLYKIHYKDKKIFSEFLFNSPTNEDFNFTYSKKENAFLCGSLTNGLGIIKFNKFNTIDPQKNFYNFSDYAIVNKKDNWYNYNGWIYNRNEKKLKNRIVNDYGSNMRFLLKYKDDFFYETNNNELISIIDLKTKTPFKISKKFTKLTSYTYLNNKLWLSNEKKIAYLENNQFIFDTFFDKVLKSQQYINAINTIDNEIVIATTQGVFYHTPNSTNIKYIEGLENANARYIKIIDPVSFWVGCYGEGLFLVHHNKAHKVVDKNININTAHAIEEDQQGNLWISTNNGLLTVNKKTTLSNTLKGIPIESYIFSKDDGLPTNEFNGGSTFPSLQTKNGTIGFPSMKGFVWFEPNAIKKQLFSGKIIMDEVLADNIRIDENSKKLYNIPKETEIVALNFSYGYSTNKQNLTISRKFEDQNNWTEIKGTSFQIPRYKKGKQKLLIKIKTHGFDNKSAVIQSLTLNFEAKNYETIWFWALIIVAFLTSLVLSYLIGLNFYKKRKQLLELKIQEKTVALQENNKELLATKTLIQESLLEKELLLKEVHHRVKNNLQLIMSMLNIQARRKNYDSIFEFLKKGESRINAMALIHQRLYQTDKSFDKINLQLYIEELKNSILQTIGDSKKEILITVEKNGITVNISTAIPLGLIINELVTNSIKYAFPDDIKGIILIKIQEYENNKFELIFEDNGIGFAQNENQSNSFGLELVDLLTNQLKGNLNLDFSEKTTYTIQFEEVALQ